MKRHIFIGLLLLSEMAHCQSTLFLAEKEKGYLSLQMLGAAIPVGNFSNNPNNFTLNGNQNGQGCAKTGFAMALDYMGYFNKYAGVGASFGYITHGLDAEAYRQSYETPPTISNTESKSNAWQIPYTGATVGIRFPLEKLTIQFKGIAALTCVTFPQTSFSYRYPSYSYSYYGSSNYQNVSYSEKTPFVFSPLFGVAFGVRYQFGIAGLNLEATYLASPEINFPVTGNYSASSSRAYSYTKTIAITNLLLSFGVSFGIH